jgi:hypothetical protein
VIGMRTKVLIWIAALPILAAAAIAVIALVILLFSGLGVAVPIFHMARIVALLIVWLVIVISAVASFRHDRKRQIRN